MLPVQITLKDIPSSPALHNHIRIKAQKLTLYSQKINRCHVVVQVPQKHKQQGKIFSVNIDITVPGKEIVVNHKQDEDVYVAVRDAFYAIERQLEKYLRKRSGHVKHHDIQSRGYITRLFSKEGYGFIMGINGNEYYFSTTHVAHPAFEMLNEGDYVSFIESFANDGLQANHITIEKSARNDLEFTSLQ